MIAWSSNTRKREKPPTREIVWNHLLLNGDIQVIFEEDNENDPNPVHPYKDFRFLPAHRQRYYIAMWNEGCWEPMLQVWADFDVRRIIVGYDRLQADESTEEEFCGLFRDSDADQRPLFLRGYEANFLSFDLHHKEYMIGCTAKEWSLGNNAGSDDKWLKDGYVHTNRKFPSVMERIELVQYLL